jgi:hypothetical protein
VGNGRGAQHLRAIAAEPRPAGSESEARARAYCAGVLADHGFSITEEPFSYSTWVGRWATPAIGVVSLGTMLAASLLARGDRVPDALTLLVAALIAVWLGGRTLARHGVTGLPIARARGVNLVATRGEPRIWLVAHLDSKSQPVPIAVRAMAIMTTAVVWLLAIALAVLDVRRGAPSVWWLPLGLLGAVAAVPIALTTVGTRSHGAVDNASGVATVLAAVERLPREVSVGVVLPSAEELGLAGARQWVLRRSPGGVAINIDTIDDAGDLLALYTGARPSALLARVARGSEETNVPVAARRLLPGVLTDGVALADAGWSVVTLGRANWRTLARVHRPADSLASLEGTGIDDAARVTAAVVQHAED